MNEHIIRAALVLTNHIRLLLQNESVIHNYQGGLCSLMGRHVRNSIVLYETLPNATTQDFQFAIMIIKNIWKSWPRFSGNHMFPIKAPWWRFTSAQNYFITGDNFRGRRLRDRRQLMDFTHQTLQNMLLRWSKP